MNPYLSTWEYSHYTMRGGAEGLDKAYAQGWSFHPKEIISFIVPDFWGGIDDHTGRNYWGYMPFTQIYNYFGIVVLALGVLALWSSKKGLALFLWISSALFTLMSFGSATPGLAIFQQVPGAFHDSDHGAVQCRDSGRTGTAASAGKHRQSLVAEALPKDILDPGRSVCVVDTGCQKHL
jgi:hypothetical protein